MRVLLPVASCIVLSSCVIAWLAGGDAASPKVPGPVGYARWRNLSLADEAGHIPLDAHMRAREQAAALPAVAVGGLERARWVELGAGNIGGRIRAIAFDPSNASNILVGSVAGGIWRSTNAGLAWTPVADLTTNLAITSIVFKPGAPTDVFAATGEGFFNTDAVRGAGIFTSTDSGATWARLAGTATTDFIYVNRLSFSADGNVLLAATSTGIWRSDRGAAFEKKFPAAGSAHLRQVLFHPTDSTRAVAHVYVPGTPNVAKVMYSNDGGATWNNAGGTLTATSGFLDRVEMVFHRGWTGNVKGCVYAMKYVWHATTPTWELHRSDDGAETFARITITVPATFAPGGAGWYYNTLWVDPTDRDANPANDKVVFGAIDLWRSTNGGAAFTKISDWAQWPTSAHADHHIIIEEPGFSATNRTVYFGNDGGLWYTVNIDTVTTTTGWQHLNNRLRITQYFGASRSPQSGVIVGGTQDAGTLRYTPARGLNDWRTMGSGDGGFCASDPVDSNYHYGEYIHLEVYRSTNGGQTSANIIGGLTDARSTTNANFIAPLVMSPRNPSLLFGGARRLWRCDDAKAAVPAWTAVPTTNTVNISAIALSHTSNDVAWIGCNNGDVFSTANLTNAAPTWVKRDDVAGSVLPNRFVTRIVVDPANHARVYVTFGGYEATNLWFTTNGGGTWANLAMPVAVPARDVERNPRDGNVLYLATEVGLFVSENHGAVWSYDATPSGCSIDELFVSQGHLYLVTHGRGIYSQSPFPAVNANVGVPCQFNGPVAGPTLALTPVILGQVATATVTGAVPFSIAVLFLGGIAPVPLPISPGCFVQIDPNTMITVSQFPIGAAGVGAFSMPIPAVEGIAGASLMTQAAAIDPVTQRLWLTNGVRVTLGY